MNENLEEPKKPIISKKFLRITITGLILLSIIVFIAYSYAYSYINNYPERYPDKTLELEDRVISFFDSITFPIKVAKLSLQEPDKEILMPVYGHRISEIADTWGSPRSEGRLHEGQDIFAGRGTPVFSATKGYVTRITESSLGGNYVYIIGAGGVRYYYAHLDRFPDGLKVGDEVTTDTVIGFVGNTGNAETTPFHLHFGVYVDREAVDPLPLLINR